MEGNLKGLTLYVVVFRNRFANEIQSYKVVAKNEFRAGRLFYKKYDRKSYHDCIEQIIPISKFL